MRYLYFTVLRVDEDGKQESFVVKLAPNTNIASALRDYAIAHFCVTKKGAQELADAWNATAKANGVYLWA